MNYYAIPLDLFGSVSAGFAVSLLTGVFGLMQAFLSPVIGGSSEKFGWQPVCVAISHCRWFGASFAGRVSQAMRLKRAVWKLLGKDPDAVVVSFLAGPEPLREPCSRSSLASFRIASISRSLIYLIEGVPASGPTTCRGPLRRKRIGLAPTLFARGGISASVARRSAGPGQNPCL